MFYLKRYTAISLLALSLGPSAFALDSLETISLKNHDATFQVALFGKDNNKRDKTAPSEIEGGSTEYPDSFSIDEILKDGATGKTEETPEEKQDQNVPPATSDTSTTPSN